MVIPQSEYIHGPVRKDVACEHLLGCTSVHQLIMWMYLKYFSSSLHKYASRQIYTPKTGIDNTNLNVFCLSTKYHLRQFDKGKKSQKKTNTALIYTPKFSEVEHFLKSLISSLWVVFSWLCLLVGSLWPWFPFHEVQQYNKTRGLQTRRHILDLDIAIN